MDNPVHVLHVDDDPRLGELVAEFRRIRGESLALQGGDEADKPYEPALSSVPASCHVVRQLA
jgi:hypothetical protein